MQEGVAPSRKSRAGRCVALALAATLLCGCASPARLFIHPRAEFIGTPADFGAVYEEVRMPRKDGGETRGWWIPNPATDAAVVLFGGNSGNRSHHLAYARMVWGAGFSVLMTEYQGFGPDGGEPSLAAFGPDGEAAVAWAAGKSPRVGVWGISLGSAVALHAAASRPDVVKAACVEGSFRLGPAMRSYMEHAMPAVLAVPLAALTRAIFIPEDSDPEASVAGISAPVFFIHGDRDELTRTLWAAELYESAPGPREFWLMDDTGHAPEPLRSCDGEYQEQIACFFRRTLLGERQPQVVAKWTSCGVEGAWEIEADVVCEGPFPAAVEVVAIGDGATARERVWMTGPNAHVFLVLDAEPASVSARRWIRVDHAGATWRPAWTSISKGYRWLRNVNRVIPEGRTPVAELLAAEVDEVLGPAYTATLIRAALASDDKEASRQLFERAVSTAQEKPYYYILGDAVYYEPQEWSRQSVAEMLPALFKLKGIQPPGEKNRALPVPIGEK